MTNEEDKLCINVWLDETNLSWNFQKNAYIAHEIAQTVPLINKEQIYERWLEENKWVKDYWPNALPKTKKRVFRRVNTAKEQMFQRVLEYVCFKLQFLYMYPKITREIVTPHIALFHPYDWGQKVMSTLKQRGVIEM